MNRTTPPAAPAFEDLPPRRSPAAGARKDFVVSLKIVTPILGGGYRARTPDDVDLIRVPTVRGHLRFWWRALFAGGFERSAPLCLGNSTVKDSWRSWTGRWPRWSPTDPMSGTSRATETDDQQAPSAHLLPSPGLINFVIRGGLIRYVRRAEWRRGDTESACRSRALGSAEGVLTLEDLIARQDLAAPPPRNMLDSMNGKNTLVLLVGANPLPNYLAAATLRPQRVLLLYTPETKQPKDRLTRALRDRLRIAAVDERQVEDATSAKRVRAVCEEVFTNDVHLNYTGGTKVMAAIARMAFRERGGRDRDASYVNESDGLLRFDDDGPSRALTTDALDLDTILALHDFDKKVAKTVLANDPTGMDAEAVALACLANQQLARSLYKRLTRPEDTRGRGISASDFATCPLTDWSFPGRSRVPGADWTTKEIEHWVKFLRGPWLEQWAADVMRQMAGSDASLHVGVNLTRDTRDTELDVIIIRQHRLHLLSCTIDDNIHLCKLKLFEATWRARQVGGGLARSALASFLSTSDADKVRTDVAATWGESNTPTVFDLADLRAWQGLDQTIDRSSLERWLLS